ncbi:hypothetical protein A1O3_05514 [Capronia epimyces CBS 606.96]|uniref:ASST-domain-containing protein n=1 Tax=Capronia epimyces CBS 606.96 TaxID=1182542 RepID=W9Y5F8_9EURO|nr:uncharacterized protein A1O3_05514 [Capronia epimyces CBS 606.96]EXJ84840.1 hypothetical protein A1O3_05514 [Capronia epimyces CBS 606.96]
MLILTVASYLICLVSLLGLSAAEAEYQFFYSRPELYPPVLQVDILKEGATPGYVFVAPHHIERSGAAIYDNHGNLVWTSLSSMGGGNMHSFRVCQYKGADHLCFFRGDQWSTFYAGEVLIYSNELVPVATIKAQNGRPAIDMHENSLVDDGRAMIVNIYQSERYDLSDYGISDGEGWVRNGLFQKIDVATGELLFEWSALDHIPPSESYVALGSTEGVTAGEGFDAGGAWDYLHLNAVDQNADGDYLLSCRHTQALYKVSGQDGRILWRLGGKRSDFELGDGVAFGYQHDARWRFSNASTDIITLFDNASDSFHDTALRSAGKIIRLDHDSTPPRATLLAAFEGPDGMPHAVTQGSVQVLGEHAADANVTQSNVFIGWGQQPYVTEHLPSGEIVFQARLPAAGANVYRAYRFNFTAHPLDSPALYTYALDTDAAATMFYMSWNGATELAQWRVYGRQNCTADWTDLGTVDKEGFESVFEAPGYWAYGMVEALDQAARPLGRSATNGIRTFVPSPALAQSCGRIGCRMTRLRGAATAPSPGEGQGQDQDQLRGGCPFTRDDKTLKAGLSVETSDVDPRLGTFARGGLLLFAGLLVCLVLTVVACYYYDGHVPRLLTSTSTSTSTSHALVPQSDPELEPMVEWPENQASRSHTRLHVV